MILTSNYPAKIEVIAMPYFDKKKEKKKESSQLTWRKDQK